MLGLQDLRNLPNDLQRKLRELREQDWEQVAREKIDERVRIITAGANEKAQPALQGAYHVVPHAHPPTLLPACCDVVYAHVPPGLSQCLHVLYRNCDRFDPYGLLCADTGYGV